MVIVAQQQSRSQSHNSHLDTFARQGLGLGLGPIHGHSLQPSAMPPPPPSVSPKISHFQVSSRFLKKPNIPHEEDVFYTPSRDRSRGTERDRSALALIDNNQSRASGSKYPTVYHTSIPKAPVIPDVFTPIAGGAGQKRGIENKDIFRGDGNDVRPVKRRALEESANITGTNPIRARDSKAARGAVELEQEKWRAKWIKSFPSLTFHFEVEAEQGLGKGLKARAIKMGAKTEQFFSAKVTHLVVKNLASPVKPKPGLSKGLGLKGSPKNPFYDSKAGSSLAQKAESLGIKVWTLKKLADILDRLAPVGQAAIQSNSLSTLLQDEKLHGTRERDANAPRPDWYYFRHGSKYLLVEDATAKHRTILVKEYQQPNKLAPEYPILFDTFLKPSAGAETDIPLKEIRARAWSLYVDQKPYKGEPVPASIQQSTSLRSVIGTPSAPDVQPYHQASGNSVVITSNIASTSTANYSPAFANNGVPALGAGKDRAIMQMSKRVQVLKGNAARAKLGSSTNPNSSRYAPPIRSSVGCTTLQERTFMTQDQILAMLRKQRDPAPPDDLVTVERRIRNRERVEAGIKGIKEQDTSSGYCENCRLRYDDLSSHLISRKHRRFAENPNNFADLDSLLKLLRRQINPNFAHPDLPFAPCWTDHEKDAVCDKCILSDPLADADDDDEATPEASSGGMEEWVVEEDENVPASVSSQADGDVGIFVEGDDEEEGGFFEESAEGKDYE